MDFELNQEQRMYQKAVRDFCEGEIKPHAAEVDRNGDLRWDVIGKMPELGLTGLQVPEEYGGAGLDSISAAIAIEEMGRVCGSTALSVSAHNGLCCTPIALWGTKEQKEKYLPPLVSGKALGSIALTEPSGGSDLAGGVQTTAVIEGDSWIIDGTKAWITNAKFAPVVVTLCRTDKQAGTRGFSLILVAGGTPGMEVQPTEHKMGLRGSATSGITFEECRVPRTETLGAEGDGFKQAMIALDGGRISIGALSVGLAQGALEESIRYAKQREAFGQKIANLQAIQFMIADAAMEIDAARLMVYRAAWLKDNGKPYSKAAAMAKLMASEVSEKVCHDAIQIHGSYGYSQEFPVERMYRDQRLMTIGEGTSQVVRMVIARRVLEDYS